MISKTISHHSILEKLDGGDMMAIRVGRWKVVFLMQEHEGHRRLEEGVYQASSALDLRHARRTVRAPRDVYLLQPVVHRASPHVVRGNGAGRTMAPEFQRVSPSGRSPPASTVQTWVVPADESERTRFRVVERGEGEFCNFAHVSFVSWLPHSAESLFASELATNSPLALCYCPSEPVFASPRRG
jgi:hypothetical protein